MKYLFVLFLASLSACGDASRIIDPNTYKKCSEYSVSRSRHVYLDLAESETTENVTWVMTYEGKSITLTDSQAVRLDTDPTGVCREVM